MMQSIAIWLQQLGEIKPILFQLFFPPAGPLLWLALGCGLWLRTSWRKTGKVICGVTWILAWLLACNGFGIWLHEVLLPHYPPQTATDLQQQQAQAIVVLGGGLVPQSPEYSGTPQPNHASEKRLRYAALLHQQSQIPMAFSGGVGWGYADASIASEAAAAQNWLIPWGITLTWIDGTSRDTQENAQHMAQLLLPHHRRIALVTHMSHMPRSVQWFERQGFEVIPVPVGYPQAVSRPLLEWIPSSQGVELCRNALRDALGTWLSRFG